MHLYYRCLCLYFFVFISFKKIHHFYIILMFEEEEEHLWIYTLTCDYSLWYKSKKWRYIKFRYTIIIIYLCHLLWICELSNIHYFFLSLHLYIEFSCIHNLAFMQNNFRLSIWFFSLIFFWKWQEKKKKGRNQFSCGSSYSNSNTAFGFYIWWYWLF